VQHARYAAARLLTHAFTECAVASARVAYSAASLRFIETAALITGLHSSSDKSSSAHIYVGLTCVCSVCACMQYMYT
jgi:hypothetical protein